MENIVFISPFLRKLLKKKTNLNQEIGKNFKTHGSKIEGLLSRNSGVLELLQSDDYTIAEQSKIKINNGQNNNNSNGVNF